MPRAAEVSVCSSSHPLFTFCLPNLESCFRPTRAQQRLAVEGRVTPPVCFRRGEGRKGAQFVLIQTSRLKKTQGGRVRRNLPRAQARERVRVLRVVPHRQVRRKQRNAPLDQEANRGEASNESTRVTGRG